MKIKDLETVYSLLENIETNITDSHILVKHNKEYQLSLGRIWFNLLLPEDYKLVDQPINKKDLSKVLSDIFSKYGTEKTAEIISLITDETFRLGTIIPASFSNKSFVLPDFIKKKKAEQLTSDLTAEEFHKRLEVLANELLDYLDKTNTPGYEIVKSGAKGKPVDWAMLVIAKGIAVDIEGNITKPSTNSISDGFSLQEYHNNANEARRGHFIKSEGSAEPGALARDISYANANTKVGIDDCGTKLYFSYNVTKNNSSKIIGRFIVTEKNNLVELTSDNITSYIDTTVNLRSPLYCINPGSDICKTCLGKISEKIDSKYIGIVTGTILNSATVESFAMKARHSAAIKDIRLVDFTKDLLSV